MVREKTWDEFRDAKMLWWINRQLHLFGWALVVEGETTESGFKCTRAYPAEVDFRGFSEDQETEGFIKLTEHLIKNLKEVSE